MHLEADVGPAARALARWFQSARRDLPWRRDRDPYRVWLSEVMLQQTQVATVIPYYEKFLARFPTVEALARADEADVFALWAGLGYYSRARNLLRGARAVVAAHEGRFPSSVDGLRALPGVGPYTAGAVASIAFGVPAPIVDGNVARVFGRVYAIATPPKAAATQALLWKLARHWVEAGAAPGDVNQGLMELGATVCTRTRPRCGACPLSAHCEAFASGRTDDFPVPDPRRKPVDLRWLSAVVENAARDRVYLVAADRGRWWRGLRDFPREELGPATAAERAEHLAERLGALDVAPLGAVKHSVTHHRIVVEPYRLRLGSDGKRALAFLPPGEWVDAEALETARLSGLARKIALRRAALRPESSGTIEG
jgi:A/G-specific adenine glycosylase